MKKTAIFLMILVSLAISSASAQEYCMTAPIGYGRAATGGAGGDVKTVKTRAELQAALKATGKAIIIVTQDITFGSGEQIAEKITDKTLLGLKGVTLTTTHRNTNGGILRFKSGSNNVIIRNLIFEGPGAYDVNGNDLIQNTDCTNLWVDHCEFYDGVDGNFDNTNSADNITISWCKFGYKIAPIARGPGGDSDDHRFTNLIGGGSSDYPSDGRYSITFQYCYWGDGCKSRMPRARNAELHILNCYYNIPTTSSSGTKTSSTALGLGAGSKGTVCYVEGTNFAQVNKVLDASFDKVSGQSVSVKFVDCLNGASGQGTVDKPDYSYAALSASAVEAAVTSACGAGATLTVTTLGEVSSSCGSDTPALKVPEHDGAFSGADWIDIAWKSVEGATGYRVNVCGNEEKDTNRTWDFSGTWTIDASDADANLVLSKVGDVEARFDYAPTTSSEELKFANGDIIPDTKDLFFTAGGVSKLRLGFGTGVIYLNGSKISVAIPCAKGNKVVIDGLAGNASAVDRGFSVSGGTVDATGTSSNIANGILTEAGASATWSYIASSDQLILTTAGGGMNISKITVYADDAAIINTCSEYDAAANATSIRINNLQGGTTYSYQIKAIRNGEQSAYNEVKSITTSGSSIDNPFAQAFTVAIDEYEIAVEGIEVNEMTLFALSGAKVKTQYASSSMDIYALEKGVYILSIQTQDGQTFTKKIIK